MPDVLRRESTTDGAPPGAIMVPLASFDAFIARERLRGIAMWVLAGALILSLILNVTVVAALLQVGDTSTTTQCRVEISAAYDEKIAEVFEAFARPVTRQGVPLTPEEQQELARKLRAPVQLARLRKDPAPCSAKERIDKVP